jgi:hypothetical protein
MPNSSSVYMTNSNKIRNKNKNKIRNKNINSERLRIDNSVPLQLETEYAANCLICLEPSQETNKLFRMKDILLINSHCECNGNLHMNCLTNWISVSKTCPICRDALTINLEILRQVDTFHSSALIVKLNLIIRKFVNIFYEIVMMMTRYLFFLFLLNALLRLARDIYSLLNDKQ